MADPTLRSLDDTQFAPINECIYCGGMINLSKEHIIPYGLGGRPYLPKASCPDCARIPSTAQLTIITPEGEQVVDVPINEYPVILPLPLYPPPACLDGRQPKGDVEPVGSYAVMLGKPVDQVMQKLGASEIVVSTEIDPLAFARFFGKIAIAYAVSERGVHAIRNSPLRRAVLTGTGIAQWVGTYATEAPPIPGVLHHLSLIEGPDRTWWGVGVHLFADTQGPRYVCVVAPPAPLPLLIAWLIAREILAR